jgi:hypothetical protein
VAVARADADPEPAALVVTRDEGARDCADTEALASMVRAIAGHDVVTPASEQSRSNWIEVEMTGGLGGYRASIQAHGRRSGTRVISDVGPSCNDISHAVAVALAVILDANPPPAHDEPPPMTPRPPAPERASPRAVPRVRAGVEVSGGLAIGVLAHVVPMLEGAARLALDRRWIIEAGGGFVFVDRVQRAEGSVELSLIEGHARACAAVLSGENGTVELCLEPLFGSLHGAGRGFDSTSSTHLLWAAIGAGFGAHGSLGHDAGWLLRALAIAPLVRQGFSVTLAGERQPAFVTPRAGGMLAIGFIYGA